MNDTPVPRIEATNLSNLDDIRHAFFTREGGVSGSIYGSLNVGFGSKDQTENVAEESAPRNGIDQSGRRRASYRFSSAR